MKIKSLFLPLVISLLSTNALLLPSLARTQERGLGTGQETPTASAGRYYALVIGNNAYTSLPKLKTAEADAREVAVLLKDYYGFETKILLNATRGQIVSALSSYRRALGPEASLLIYYAGHGVNDADKAYWLPVDAERDDTANWIIADTITQMLKVIPARHVLVVSDSCYSGTLTRGLGESLPRATEREHFLQRMATGRSRTLMASGGDEPVADGGGDGRHSVFANALLRGLQVMDKARFTGAELFRDYVEESVAGRANQTPEYNPLKNSGHESGDFIFIRIKTDGKNAEMAVKSPTGPVAVDPAAFELEYWNAIKGSSDPEEYRDYLEKYPNGQFAAIARRRAAGGRDGNNTGGGAPAVSNPPAVNSGSRSNAARPAAASARLSPPVPANLLRSFEYLTLTLDARGNLKSRGNKSATYYAEDLGGGVGLEMVEVPGGSFLMGSPDTEANRSKDEGPQHQVTVPVFWMGKYEVTQAQYQAVMGTNPANFKGSNLPVEQVSWNDAMEFCQRLSAKTGREYRLPSEAEWEYAARAKTTTPFAFGETVTPELVNYDGNYPYGNAAKGAYREKTMDAGASGAANGFGLFDMHGNVWEWCLDHWHENYGGLVSNAPTDGAAWLSGGDSTLRVLRGGSWNGDAGHCRSALRGGNEQGKRNLLIGFRVAASARAV